MGKSILIFLLLITRFAFGQSKDQAQNITKEKLSSIITIEEIIPGFPKDEFVVSGFRMTIIARGQSPREYKINGNRWSRQIREILLSLPVGTKVYLEYIQGKMIDSGDESSRTFNPAAFIITAK